MKTELDVARNISSISAALLNGKITAGNGVYNLYTHCADYYLKMRNSWL